MSSSRKSDQRKLIEAAVDQGWRIVEKSKSIQLRAPDGVGQVTVHLTESDHRANKNTRAALKRMGVVGV